MTNDFERAKACRTSRHAYLRDIPEVIGSFESKTTALEIKSARHMKRARIGGYIALGFGVIACGAIMSLAFQDLGLDKPHVEAPARPVPPGYAVIEAPNPHDNVVTFCHLGNRIYQKETSAQTLAVVPADPSCQGS